MPRKIVEQPKAEHTCLFTRWADPSTLKCMCGKVLIGQGELQRRAEEYEAYYKAVRHTDSYRDFCWLKAAWKQRDMNKVTLIGKIAKRRLDQDNYMLRPVFPDPKTYPYMVKGLDIA